MTPELACAVLSFRDEPGLIDAVRSVLDQSDPVEVVVANSGGGDPAARLAAAGIDLRVISFEERLYPGGVRNVGIEATEAPYVAFLAADCIAEPGWVAGRLREHRAGAAAVASSVWNAFPDSTCAWASLLLLHSRLTELNKPGQRLLYGLSYDRRLFERYGLFREDLRAGEDTEFNARLGPEARVVAARGVRTAHRYPTEIPAMLQDAYRRGRLQAAMLGAIAGGGSPKTATVVSRGPQNILRSFRCAWRAPREQRRRFLSAWPLVPVAGVVYAAGAVSARWRPYDGFDAVKPARRVTENVRA